MSSDDPWHNSYHRGFSLFLCWNIRCTAARTRPASCLECASLSALSCRTGERCVRLVCDWYCHYWCVYTDRCLGAARTHPYWSVLLVDAHRLSRLVALSLPGTYSEIGKERRRSHLLKANESIRQAQQGEVAMSKLVPAHKRISISCIPFSSATTKVISRPRDQAGICQCMIYSLLS